MVLCEQYKCYRNITFTVPPGSGMGHFVSAASLQLKRKVGSHCSKNKGTPELMRFYVPLVCISCCQFENTWKRRSMVGRRSWCFLLCGFTEKTPNGSLVSTIYSHIEQVNLCLPLPAWVFTSSLTESNSLDKQNTQKSFASHRYLSRTGWHRCSWYSSMLVGFPSIPLVGGCLILLFCDLFSSNYKF